MPRSAPNGFAYVNQAYYCPIASGTSGEEYVTDELSSTRFRVTKVWSVINTAITGSGATHDFLLVRTRGSTDVTVASKTIALADAGTRGIVIAWTVSTTDYTFEDGDKLSLVCASGGTSMTAGAMTVYVQKRMRLQGPQ